MEKEILRDLIDSIERKQKQVSTIEQIVRLISGINIIEFDPDRKALFLHDGIKEAAALYDEQLLFVPVDYESENWGNAYFYHDGVRVFQIINEEELAALGGDVA